MKWLLRRRIFEYITLSPADTLWFGLFLGISMFSKELGIFTPLGVLGYTTVYLLGIYILNKNTYEEE